MLSIVSAKLTIYLLLKSYSYLLGLSVYIWRIADPKMHPFLTRVGKKVQVGNDEEMAQSERNSHSKNRGGKNPKLTIRYLHL